MWIEILFWGVISISAVVLGADIPLLGLLVLLACDLFVCRKLYIGEWKWR